MAGLTRYERALLVLNLSDFINRFWQSNQATWSSDVKKSPFAYFTLSDIFQSQTSLLPLGDGLSCISLQQKDRYPKISLNDIQIFFF